MYQNPIWRPKIKNKQFDRYPLSAGGQITEDCSIFDLPYANHAVGFENNCWNLFGIRQTHELGARRF